MSERVPGRRAVELPLHIVAIGTPKTRPSRHGVRVRRGVESVRSANADEIADEVAVMEVVPKKRPQTSTRNVPLQSREPDAKQLQLWLTEACDPQKLCTRQIACAS